MKELKLLEKLEKKFGPFPGVVEDLLDKTGKFCNSQSLEKTIIPSTPIEDVLGDGATSQVVSPPEEAPPYDFIDRTSEFYIAPKGEPFMKIDDEDDLEVLKKKIINLEVIFGNKKEYYQHICETYSGVEKITKNTKRNIGSGLNQIVYGEKSTKKITTLLEKKVVKGYVYKLIQCLPALQEADRKKVMNGLNDYLQNIGIYSKPIRCGIVLTDDMKSFLYNNYETEFLKIEGNMIKKILFPSYYVSYFDEDEEEIVEERVGEGQVE